METAGFDFNLFYTPVNIVLMIAAIVTGKNISAKAKYWRNALGFTAIYSLVLGLRYNRGNDYLHYVDVFKYDLEERQVVFTWFNHILKAIGVGPYACFTFYAAVLCICFFVFLTDYKKYAKWMVPFFLISFIWFEEFVIRQCFSWSFVFLLLKLLHVLNRYQENKKVSSIVKTKIYIGILVISYIIYGTHSANLFVVLVVLAFYVANRIISWKIAVPIYVFAAYLFSSVFKGDFISQYLILFQGFDSKLDGYANEGEKWFDTTNDIGSVRGGAIKLLETWGTMALIYFGHRLYDLHRNRMYVAIYNTFVFGTILRHAFFHLEILNRLGLVLEILWFFPLSLFAVDNHKMRLSNNEILFRIGLLWYMVEYIKYIAFRNADRMLFLWDM